MKLTRKILLATDFSRSTNDAVRLLISLVPRLDAGVVLLHVLPGKRIFAELSEDLRDQALGQLGALRNRLHDEGVTDLSVEIRTGVDHEEIVGFAESHDVSLVVIGVGRPGEDDAPRLGATAERVVRHCRKPVWVVRPGRRTEIRRILCPVDMSEHSARALRSAIGLATKTGASLQVLHVVRPLASFVPRGATLGDGMEREYVDKRKRDYASFLRQFDFDQLRWSHTTRSGIPEDVIAELAQRERIDLLVMGSLGSTGVPRQVLGSVAASVTRTLPCSVLTVKEVDAFQAGLEPELEEIWRCYERGRKMLEQTRYADAAEQFEVCISLNRLFVRAWDGLAAAHEKLGHTDVAADCRAASSKILEEIGELHLAREQRPIPEGSRVGPSRRPFE
jgi:nucleotide-binding universal stress UspA family protein